MPNVKYANEAELKEMDVSLKSRARALLDEARLITGSVSNFRQMNGEEASRVRSLMVDAEKLVDERKTVKSRIDQLEQIEAERYARVSSYKPIPNLSGDSMPTAATPAGGKSRDARWSSMAMTQLQRFDPYGGMGKSLASSGSVLVPTSFDTSIVREGERPTLVRELLPSQSLTGTDRFAYLRQSARINNATTVAKGALKPTSSYKVERLEDRARVIAHLSEPIDRVDLEDAADLGNFLDSEMRYGVLAAGEDQIINGDGNGENQIGIRHTSGVLAQAYSGDALTTLRKALTVQQGLSNTPTAWVLSPADWESLELLREGGATGAYMLSQGPVDRAAQRLWGLPVVVSSAIATGRAILGDWAGSARLYQREEVQVTWSDGVWAGDGAGGGSIGFQRNQLTMRAEERVGLAVLRPSAFADIDLAA